VPGPRALGCGIQQRRKPLVQLAAGAAAQIANLEPLASRACDVEPKLAIAGDDGTARRLQSGRKQPAQNAHRGALDESQHYNSPTAGM
jgi:hypothetical protein